MQSYAMVKVSKCPEWTGRSSLASKVREEEVLKRYGEVKQSKEEELWYEMKR